MIRELIKPLLIIALIIVFCTVLVRVMLSGDTLAEYAAKNPGIAYPSPDVEVTEESTAREEALDDSDDLDEMLPLADDLDADDIIDEESEIIIAVSKWSVAENMSRFMPGFYKEPIGDGLFMYISGISFPVTPEEAAAIIERQGNEFGPDYELSNVIENARDIVISREELNFLTVLHYDFDGNIKLGELICNSAIADDLLSIFYQLYLNEYRIEKIRLIEEYGGCDNLSMLDNNSSAFNYRNTNSGNLSRHAYGLAVDINPFYNPYVEFLSDGTVLILPEGSEFYADRNNDFPYKIDADDLCYRLFREHGFIWGGDWNNLKDYHHFQKAN